MFNRLSVNWLLKSVIASLAAAIVIVLALGAWNSWTRLASINRIAAVTDVTAHMFTALHNLRTDRAATNRDLAGEKQLTAPSSQVSEVRAAEMPALKAALEALPGIEFADRQTLVPSLDQAVKRLTALQAESASAFLQPKPARRAGLGPEFVKETTSLIELLDNLSAALTHSVQLEDAYIDRLMALKQLAWMGRNTAGDATVIISNMLGGLKPASDPLMLYTSNLKGFAATWMTVEALAAGVPMPARFTTALANARSGFMARDFEELRLATLKGAMAGNPPPASADDWSRMVVTKLATLLGVAEAALDAAKDYAAAQRAVATRNLYGQIGLLAAALLVATAMIWGVSRRVTGPLRQLQAAMLKLAGGDLSAAVTFAGRKDEIGALGSTMQTFKDSMIESDRLRAEQKDTELRGIAARKVEMEKLADEFQAAVGNIVEAVSTASIELEHAAGTLTKTAETTQQLSGVVASASEAASANVGSVAAATEEMTGSVNEIARQVQESSKIAAEAVAQTAKTDARISELSTAASRIGDVVKLITAIAEQTNLLALNATIEAARAGEAGRGFAVVASEVKQLATQTAKATEEIGTQIANMQSATQESVTAIKEITGTIGRMSDIAGMIAAAVEEQGAATQEIARNVQQAAEGTAQVASNITDVSRGANETGVASSRVLNSAQTLSRDSGDLKSEVEKFVRTVRAA
jgi:methyl-accepting chemotaxis protein